MKEGRGKMERKKQKDLLFYMKEYKIPLSLIFLFLFLGNFSYIFTGYLNGAAIESVVKLDIKKALFFLSVYCLIQIFGEFLRRITYYFLAKIQIKITRTIGYHTYQKALQLPAAAFEDLSSGEIINRITNDTETIAGSIHQLINILSNVISSLLILVYIFFHSWVIGLEIVTFLLLYGCIVRHFTVSLKKDDKQFKKKNDEYTAIANESIKGIREIKTLGIIHNLQDHVAHIIKELYMLSNKCNRKETLFDCISEILKSMLEVGCFMTCAISVYQGQITITFFVAMTYYIYRYTWLIENITSFTKAYERLSVSLERINQILNNELYKDVSYGNVTLQNPKGKIVFKEVDFHYKEKKEVLKGFSASFEPNQKIAIVGSSGEGKTTLFHLLTRIFDPIEGSITLDGIDIRELTEASLRENIAIIRQEPFLFHRTIFENFQLVQPNVTLDEVRKYCKMALMDAYIMDLPEQYNTLLGEGGINLSGGQKQRLSIARALFKNAKVILFDEATSALDNESQEYIKKTIDSLSKNHTILIVAHRLSTIKDADCIYVLQKGKVLAKGNHKELIQSCPFYKKLYEKEEI